MIMSLANGDEDNPRKAAFSLVVGLATLIALLLVGA